MYFVMARHARAWLHALVLLAAVTTYTAAASGAEVTKVGIQKFSAEETSVNSVAEPTDEVTEAEENQPAVNLTLLRENAKVSAERDTRGLEYAIEIRNSEVYEVAHLDQLRLGVTHLPSRRSSGGQVLASP